MAGAVSRSRRIVEYLANCDEPQATDAIAAAIGTQPGTQINGLLAYLARYSRIRCAERGSGRGNRSKWEIADAGRRWLDDEPEDYWPAPKQRIAKKAPAPTLRIDWTAGKPPSGGIAHVIILLGDSVLAARVRMRDAEAIAEEVTRKAL